MRLICSDKFCKQPWIYNKPSIYLIWLLGRGNGTLDTKPTNTSNRKQLSN